MLTSPKAHIIVAGFFLTASALTTAGCTQPSSETSYKAAGQQTGQENSYAITDDNGENVNLTENADGTYTATYDDGRTVTFRSDDNGNLTPTSGTASLLAGIAAGYLLSRGFSGGSGYYDRARDRYVATNPYTYSSANDIRNKGTSVRDIPAKGSVGAQKADSSTAARGAGGFGGAGARSAAS